MSELTNDPIEELKNLLAPEESVLEAITGVGDIIKSKDATIAEKSDRIRGLKVKVAARDGRIEGYKNVIKSLEEEVERLRSVFTDKDGIGYVAD